MIGDCWQNIGVIDGETVEDHQIGDVVHLHLVFVGDADEIHGDALVPLTTRTIEFTFTMNENWKVWRGGRGGQERLNRSNRSMNRDDVAVIMQKLEKRPSWIKTERSRQPKPASRLIIVKWYLLEALSFRRWQRGSVVSPLESLKNNEERMKKKLNT